MITRSCIKERGENFKVRPSQTLLQVAADQQTQGSTTLMFSHKQKENCAFLMLKYFRFVWLTKVISVQLRMHTV